MQTFICDTVSNKTLENEAVKLTAEKHNRT